MILPRRCSTLASVIMALAAYQPSHAAAPDTSGLEWQPHVGAPLPADVVVRDSYGNVIALHALADARPTIIDLGYFHCPSLCGVGRDSLLAALIQSRLQAGRDYTLIDISINPAEAPADAARAKAADMARYADAGAARAWHYVTADAQAGGAIARAVGFPSRWDATLQQFLHPTGIVIATPEGRIAGYVLGVGYQPGDLRAAVGRAAANEIASPPSPILLLCFHFDQATGRYTLAIMKTLRLAAALTVTGILALFFVLRRASLRRAGRGRAT